MYLVYILTLYNIVGPSENRPPHFHTQLYDKHPAGQWSSPHHKGRNQSTPVSGVPGIPRQGGQAAASIHFSDGGGGGGGKS